ncbi:hypothetical protein MTP99_014257 [Tenebrio molitor]|nr:hypothetical protein MTP99_014257 [Tenebrio molitor]
MTEECGTLHNTSIYREVLCKTHSRGSVKHMDSREGPDLVVAGQQLIEITVFCVFLYCEIGDCHQLSLLDDLLMLVKLLFQSQLSERDCRKEVCLRKHQLQALD